MNENKIQLSAPLKRDLTQLANDIHWEWTIRRTMCECIYVPQCDVLEKAAKSKYDYDTKAKSIKEWIFS